MSCSTRQLPQDTASVSGSMPSQVSFHLPESRVDNQIETWFGILSLKPSAEAASTQSRVGRTDLDLHRHLE